MGTLTEMFAQIFNFFQILTGTRDELILKKNYARTGAFKLSFFNRIVDTWNVLPLSIRQASRIFSRLLRGVRDFLSST